MGKQTDNYLALKRKCVPANQKESPKAFTLTFTPHMSLATSKQKIPDYLFHIANFTPNQIQSSIEVLNAST